MIIIEATIESIATRKDKTISIKVGSQELSPEKGGELFRIQNKLGYLAFSEAKFQPDEIEKLSSLNADLPVIGKTRSQTLRNSLYVAWQQVPEGFKEFDFYYNFKMDKFIDHVKSKLTP